MRNIFPKLGAYLSPGQLIDNLWHFVNYNFLQSTKVDSTCFNVC